MKNGHPIITATSSSLVSPDSASSNEPTEPIVRLKLDKPKHWEWELTTSADTLPVIQLLDKDGRLLVETTGQTAQRARGSFREGLKSHEEFPSRSASERPSTGSSSFSSSSAPSPTILVQGNRNIDGFSTKFGGCQFGYAPRKSRSEVTVKEKERKGKKRHSGGSEVARQAEEAKAALKKYSTGDYLRQQIIDDLRTKNTVGKSPDEIAKERCRKMKAYLRTQSEILPRLVHVEEEESSDGSKLTGDRNDDEVRSQRIKDGLMRLREAIKDEGARTEKSANLNGEREADNKLLEAPGENSKVGDTKRKIKSEELERVRSFLQRKIQQKMEQERCFGQWDGPIRPKAGIQKRSSEHRQPEDPRGYRTRKVHSETSIIRFDPEIIQKDKQRASRQVSRERSSRSSSRSKDSFQQKTYRRSKSETIFEAAETPGTEHRQRSRDPTEKRKLYRKTKSDVLLGQVGSSRDSEQENPPRRVKSKDNVDKSWREYKERKKHEKLHRESENREVKEEDFMTKPRWKDLQAELCSFKNCRICQNLRNCVDPLQQRRGSLENQKIPENEATAFEVNSGNSTDDRPRTSPQKSYSIENKPDVPVNHSSSKVQAKSHEKNASNMISPDCGYNTIPKKTCNGYKELYTRTNVKKSDTFKVVDGSEGLEETVEQDDSRGDVDGAPVDSFEGLSGEGVLANKSNEDIARDYFRRVYQLLKKRQEEARRVAEKQEKAGCDDSSSSNCTAKVQKKKLRRKKKERNAQVTYRNNIRNCPRAGGTAAVTGVSR
ncbi:unnamed protein product [Xylocopa violacea]|uniref:Uncharacterized protein n=1 Tax=Xylocopa violacea TaxID=135666 RepID=A0ABP1MYQ3_XYLVO